MQNKRNDFREVLAKNRADLETTKELANTL